MTPMAEPKRKSDLEVVGSIIGALIKLMFLGIFLVLIEVFLYEALGWLGVALPVVIIGVLYTLVRLGRRGVR